MFQKRENVKEPEPAAFIESRDFRTLWTSGNQPKHLGETARIRARSVDHGKAYLCFKLGFDIGKVGSAPHADGKLPREGVKIAKNKKRFSARRTVERRQPSAVNVRRIRKNALALAARRQRRRDFGNGKAAAQKLLTGNLMNGG